MGVDLGVKRWKPGYSDRTESVSLRQALPPDSSTQATPPSLCASFRRWQAGLISAHSKSPPRNSTNGRLCKEPHDIRSSEVGRHSTMVLSHQHDWDSIELKAEPINRAVRFEMIPQYMKLNDDDSKANALLFNNCSFKGHRIRVKAAEPPYGSGSSRSVTSGVDEVVGLSGLRRRRKRLSLRRSAFASGLPATRADDLVLARCRRNRAGLESRSGLLGHDVHCGAAFAVRHLEIASHPPVFATRGQTSLFLSYPLMEVPEQQ